jgi:hypothetical protein
LVLVGVLGLALVVVIAAGSAAYLATQKKGTVSPTATDGFAFVDGAYVAPPYAISVGETDVRLNGKVIRSLRAVPISPSPSPSTPKNAADAVLLAQARLPVAPTLTAPQRAELISYLRSLPVTANVIDSEPTSLTVVDKDGGQATLLLDRRIPDNAAQRATQRERAAQWESLLHSRGLVMIGPGVSVEAAAPRAALILTDMRQAFKQPGPDLEQALERITGAPSISKALAKAGAPPGGLYDRVSAPSPEALASSGVATAATARGVQSKLPAAAVSSAAGGQGSLPVTDAVAPPDVQTPGSEKAYIFDYFDFGDATHPRIAAIFEGYTVISVDIEPRLYGREMLTFLSIFKNGGAGFVYISSHGDSRLGLMVGVIDEIPSSEVTLLELVNGKEVERTQSTHQWIMQDTGLGDADFTLASVGVPLTVTTRDWGIFLNAKYIQDHWKDASSVIQLAVCYGKGLRDAFGAREFIAPRGIVFDRDARAFAAEFYPRLDGEKADGGKRTVAEAYAASDPLIKYYDLGFGRFFLYGSGRGRTVLAPRATAHSPDGDVQTNTEIAAEVRFDAALRTSIKPSTVVGATGSCQPELVTSTIKWQDPHTLAFTFKGHQKGTATFTIRNRLARSGANGTYLDGNSDPPGKNGVGPGSDDYTWDVTCDPDIVKIGVPVSNAVCRPADLAPCTAAGHATITTGNFLKVSYFRTTPRERFTNPQCGTVAATITVDGQSQSTGAVGVDGGSATLDFGAVKPGQHEVTVTFQVSAEGCQPQDIVGSMGSLQVTTNKAK